MPLYEYESTEHGIRVDLACAVAERPDTITLTRRTVPSRVGLCFGTPEQTPEQKMMKGYRRLEEKGQMQDRPGSLSAAQVKRALTSP